MNARIWLVLVFQAVISSVIFTDAHDLSLWTPPLVGFLVALTLPMPRIPGVTV